MAIGGAKYQQKDFHICQKRCTPELTLWMLDGGSDVEFGDLEMNLEFDCSCCVCKTFTQESGNKLMECSSCQNLYHQECHNPPVSVLLQT